MSDLADVGCPTDTPAPGNREITVDHDWTSSRRNRILGPVVYPAARLLSAIGTDLPKRGAVGPQFVGDDTLRIPVLVHCFSEEFQGGLPVSCLGNEALQDLSLVNDGPPEAVLLTVDLHKHLVEMPSPTA
jgi:hypothetical protein